MNLEEKTIQEAIKKDIALKKYEPEYTKHLQGWFIGLFMCLFVPAVISPLMALISWSIATAKYNAKYKAQERVVGAGIEVLTSRFLQMPVVDTICGELVKHFLKRDDLGEVENLDGRTNYSVTYHILQDKIALHEEESWNSSSESIVDYSFGEVTVRPREYTKDIYHPIVAFSDLQMSNLPHRIYQLALINAIKSKFIVHIIQDTRFQKLNQPQIFYKESANSIIRPRSYFGRDEKPNLTITLEYVCKKLQRNQW